MKSEKQTGQIVVTARHINMNLRIAYANGGFRTAWEYAKLRDIGLTKEQVLAIGGGDAMLEGDTEIGLTYVELESE